MKIKVKYCQHVRKDGTSNMVLFDTEKKKFTIWDSIYIPNVAFIEAHMSRDVNALRRYLTNNGYTLCDCKELLD